MTERAGPDAGPGAAPSKPAGPDAGPGAAPSKPAGPDASDHDAGESAGPWEPAFVAVSLVLGESVDAIAAALGPEAAAANDVESLRTASREARARRIAHGLSDVVVALRTGRLA